MRKLGLLLAALLLLATAAASSAATLRYRVPDSPWVQAMLVMMEMMGILEPLPDPTSLSGFPYYGVPAARGGPWADPFGYRPPRSWPGSGWGVAGDGPPWAPTGLTGGVPRPPGGFFPVAPAGGRAWAAPGGWRGGGPYADLAGLWVSDQGETLWIDRDRFAYRDGLDRRLSGRLQLRGDRLTAVLGDGAAAAFQYRIAGPYLMVGDPGGNVRRFRRLR